MYAFDWRGDLRALIRRAVPGAARRRVPPNVWALGVTSLVTDVSSEMVVSILPLYLVLTLGLSPLAFGLVEGLYPGLTTLVRWVGGIAGDRVARHKPLAVAGYAVSAATRLAWLAAGTSLPAIGALITADRLGKGLRTAPRDALISLSTPTAALGRAFGLHRAMDAAGALSGPLVAFALLAWMPRRFDLVFVASFGAAVIGLAVLVLFVREPAASRPDTRPRVAGLRAQVLARDALRRPLAAAALLSALTVSDGLVYLALQQRGKVPPAWLPLLFAGTSAAYLLLAVPMGALADRWTRGTVFVAGHGALGLLYLVLLAPPPGLWGVALALVLLGTYYAATDGVLAALASAALPPESRGTGLGLMATATSLGRLVAAVACGWLWARWDVSTAFTTFAILLAPALVVARWLLGRAEREIMAA